MSQRFFVDQPITGNEVLLAGSEANHLSRVMRAQPGDRVTLFDGLGSEFLSQVLSVTRSHVRLSVLERLEINREIDGTLTLGVALPKGERQKWLVEKLVELGVTSLVPLTCERAVAKVDGKVQERLERGVIEASKQCGRNLLMRIHEPLSLGEFFELADENAVRWLADPSGKPLVAGPLSQVGRFIAIGPEGGWTAGELESARRAEWTLVGLGPRILRVETAALAAAARCAA